MENSKVNELVVFLDAIGRTIIARRSAENNTELTVANPAIVNIMPQEFTDPATGQRGQRMALQLFPLFFREFLASKDEPVKFIFKKDNITMSTSDLILDFKVGVQYDQLFINVGEINTEHTPPVNKPSELDVKKDTVINLFE